MIMALLRDEDAATSENDDALRTALESSGVTVLTGHELLRCETDGAERALIAQGPEGQLRLAYDLLICAVGRRASCGTGLWAGGVKPDGDGTVVADVDVHHRAKATCLDDKASVFAARDEAFVQRNGVAGWHR